MSLQLLIVYWISDFFLVVCLMVFTKRRYSLRTTVLMMAAIYFVVVSLENWRYRMYWAGYTWRFTMAIAAVAGVCGELAVSEYRDSRAVFTAFMSGSYIMFGNVAAKLLLSEEAALAPTILTEILIHAGFLFVLVRFLLPPYRRLQSVYRREWRLLTVILAMFYCGMYLLYDCLKRSDATAIHNMIPMAYLMTVYLLIILVFQMLGRLDERGMEERERKVLQAGMGALRVKVGELHRAERQIAEYNHNSRHFVRMLRGMMADGDYEGVEQALSEMQDVPAVTETKRYCDNIPLNGVVSYYVRAAEELLVKARVDLEELPESLAEDDLEFAMVFGKLLDNAVQASSRVEPRENRRISVRSKRSGDRTMFEICNTYSDAVVFDKLTNLPVSDSMEGCGFGLRSLTGVVKQWDGTLDCGLDGEWFYVRVTI